MSHDQAAYQPGGHAPAGGPGVFALSGLILKRDVKCFGEILPQKMAGARLKSAAVLHQCFNAQGVNRSWKFLPVALGTGQDRHGHPLFSKGFVDVEDLAGLLFRLRLGGMGGVSFLPEKLRGPKKQPGAHFPADHVAPLVNEQRQIAIALDPVLVGVPDDRFRCGPDDQLFLQLGLRIDLHTFSGNGLEAVVGDDGAFLGEALGHLLFLGQEGLGNEQGKVGIDVPARLEHAVQGALHFLPDGVAVRLDDHAAAHIGIFRQLRLLHDIEIPL